MDRAWSRHLLHHDIFCDNLHCFIWGKLLSVIRSYQSENLMIGGSTKAFPLPRSVHFIKSEELLPEKWQQNDKIPWHETLILKQWQKWERAPQFIECIDCIEFIEFVTLELVFLWIVSILWSPTNSERNTAPRSPQARYIEDFCCTGCYRFPPGKPWEVTLSEMLLMLWHVCLLFVLSIKAVFKLKLHLQTLFDCCTGVTQWWYVLLRLFKIVNHWCLAWPADELEVFSQFAFRQERRVRRQPNVLGWVVSSIR